jgi:uncharacterized membrane protein YeaQ/YmgE (transglycosylase-associated protein family)
MHLLTWILVGTAIGWGTGKILKGRGYGPLMDIFMGAAGAVIGGLVTRSAGLSGSAGFALTTLGVMISAVAVTLLAGYVNGRRLYARQL